MENYQKLFLHERLHRLQLQIENAHYNLQALLEAKQMAENELKAYNEAQAKAIQNKMAELKALEEAKPKKKTKK